MSKPSSTFARGLAVLGALCVLSLLAGCARRVQLKPLALAKGGKVTVRVELTHNRNDRLLISVEAPDPSVYGPDSTTYVAWVATPDGASMSNVGQIRVEAGKGRLLTITPQRKFRLFVTVEERGDVVRPSQNVIYESPKLIEW